ncbi:MAG TPA: RNA polymerase sigma factor SigM [Catenuloplanes sp.]
MTGGAGHTPDGYPAGDADPPAGPAGQPAAGRVPRPAAAAPGSVRAGSDAELLRAHAEGDPDAFTELFRRHRDRLWAVALRTVGDREEAADALQDALLSAHRAAARFRGDSAVTTWLHRIVVNACLDRLRRRQAHPTVPLPDGSRPDDPHGGWSGPHGVEPAAPVLDHDTALVVRAALAGLPPDQRAALILVDLQGYAVAEVAAILGVAEGTVKSRCARGRAKLAVLLGHLRPGRTVTGVAAGNREARPPVPSSGTSPAPAQARQSGQPTEQEDR